MEEEKIFSDELTDEEYLEHYGTPRHSGRYPWGSGDNPYQHSEDFLARYEELRKSGMSEKDIAEAMGMDSTTKLRAAKSIATTERRKILVESVRSLKQDGLNNVEIAEKLGLKGESTVRSLLNDEAEARMKVADALAQNLKDICDKKGMIDVGVGVERQLSSGSQKISTEKMNLALEMLKMEGYEVWSGRVQQATNKNQYTTLKVLCPPGTPHKDIFNYENIHSVDDYVSRDGGKTLEPSFVYPKALNSKRLAIRYAEDGGTDKDGVVEIRRGVKDLSLGESNYAQVRILVDGTHYIKGMAVYSDDLPDGVDVLFNTNKGKDKSKLEVLKKIKDDPDNPFGSAIKEHGGQSYYDDPNGDHINPITGKKESLSLINKRSDEGDWGEWSDHLPSQFLSKQSMPLIKKQLNLSITEKQDEFDEIMSLTNPTVKKSLLESFAEDCDSSAVHLKAAALPGQKYQVILPMTTISDKEVYAPTWPDGSQVALVRYPHGGTFEIPILTVNNRLKEGKDILGPNPSDAIGISSAVAGRLSGADFDGDTVMVIPLNSKTKIVSTPELEGLKGFEPKLKYGATEEKIIDGVTHYYRNGKEFPIMKNTQTQMGIVSNLITDMTLKGASNEELARAVRHSMVVIDAEKHHLDYVQSELDNGIAQLKKDYQYHYDPIEGKERKGASTLISQAKGELKSLKERKDGGYFTRDGDHPVKVVDAKKDIYEDAVTGEIIKKKDVKTVPWDPVTGEKLYHETNRKYLTTKVKDSNGKTRDASVIEQNGKFYFKDEDGRYTEISEEKVKSKFATTVSTRMAEVKDARQLSSGRPQEEAYAEYANKLKSLANQARKEYMATKDIPYSPEAHLQYLDESESLEKKLNIALMNAPKERQAQTIAASVIKAKKQADPRMTPEHEKKMRQQELAKARARVGAKRSPVAITENEWKAIQAGAISHTKLEKIIANADESILKQFAMPRTTTTLSNSKVGRLKAMSNSGYSTAEIAKSLGISSSTVLKYLKGKA